MEFWLHLFSYYRHLSVRISNIWKHRNKINTGWFSQCNIKFIPYSNQQLAMFLLKIEGNMTNVYILVLYTIYIAKIFKASQFFHIKVENKSGFLKENWFHILSPWKKMNMSPWRKWKYSGCMYVYIFRGKRAFIRFSGIHDPLNSGRLAKS